MKFHDMDQMNRILDILECNRCDSYLNWSKAVGFLGGFREFFNCPACGHEIFILEGVIVTERASKELTGEARISWSPKWLENTFAEGKIGKQQFEHLVRYAAMATPLLRNKDIVLDVGCASAGGLRIYNQHRNLGLTFGMDLDHRKLKSIKHDNIIPVFGNVVNKLPFKQNSYYR